MSSKISWCGGQTYWNQKILFTFPDAENQDFEKMAICHGKQEFSVLCTENGINHNHMRRQAAIVLALWALLNSKAHEPHGSKSLNNNAH